MSEREWIHRATWPDGRVRETEPRIERPGQACFAGITELLMRRHNPGLTVVHLVREVGGEWEPVGDGQVSASLSTEAAERPSAQGVDTPGPCPTCTGPIRETVGMVCQTCGTDYAANQRTRED